MFLAFLTCIWAAAGLIRPGLIPSQMGAINVVTIGLLLTLWCSDKGPHAFFRTAILAVGFGVDCAAFSLSSKNLFPVALCAALSLICFCGALAQYAKARREEEIQFTQIIVDGASPAASDRNEASKFPMIPVRNMAVVPGATTPFVVGREFSVRALEYAISHDRKIFLTTQHDPSINDPKAKELSQFGCICRILKSLEITDGDFKGNFKVLVEGMEMAESIAVDDSEGFFLATVQRLDTTPGVV
ncbi:MAG: LON peptidase substrate-binding domain-containing protein [Terracidiphilus sp.]